MYYAVLKIKVKVKHLL